MIPTKKLTPLAFGYRITSRKPPQPELTVILRGKYRMRPNQPLELVRSKLDQFGEDLESETKEKLDDAALLVGQGALRHDLFAEDDTEQKGQLLYPSDFAEWKPCAEVMLKGSCVVAKGATEAIVGLQLGELKKQLRVLGPRVWVDRILGGKHTDPLLFDRMPIDYAHAFGGTEVPENPVGRGKDSRELCNVEDIRVAGTPARAVGFGPINPLWPLRLGKRGKEYGEEYERTRAPWYPADYDWTAQNAAPADQQLKGYLRGDEELRLTNVHADAADYSTRLPGIRPRAFVMHDDGRIVEVPLVLDTVFADTDDELLYLTWRGLTAVREDDLVDIKHLYLVEEKLSEAPRPLDVHLEGFRAFAADPYGLNDNPATELAKLEEKLESGQLEKELASLKAHQDPLRAVFGPTLSKLPNGQSQLGHVRDVYARTVKGSPEAKTATSAYLLQSLRAAFDGPSGPRMVVSPKGEVEGKPMLSRMIRELVTKQKDAGVPAATTEESTASLRDQIVKADVPGLSPDDVKIPESLEPPAPGPGADFSGFDLEARDLGDLDLTGAKFDGAFLRGVHFGKAILARASFRGATLARCDFTDADCKDADFTQAHLTRVRLVRAKLTSATLDQANLVRCDLTEAHLDGAEAKMLQVEKTKLNAASCERVNFEKCGFSESEVEAARFSGAKLAKSFFRQSSMPRARLDRADISGGGFFGCDLTSASFFAAIAKTTNFQASVLKEADMRHAELESSMFLNVPAEGADLYAANLKRARFYRTGLRGARLEKANLLQADLRKAVLTDTSFRGANCYQTAFTEAYGNDADFHQANLDLANFKRSKLTKKQ